jgi:hypothetical protein
MTQRTDRAARHRVSVSAEATQRELRMRELALLNQYMAMHLVIAEHLELEPVELLILVATMTGNGQRAVRPDALPEVLRGSTPMPQELIVPMSRRAILLSMSRGVRAKPGLADRKAMTAILRVVELHAACTEQLIKFGAITTRPAGPARSRRA